MDEQSSASSGNSGWVVLAALGLVLVGSITFVVGRVAADSLFDYVSIACSAAAAVMLVVTVRGSKRTRRVGA